MDDPGKDPGRTPFLPILLYVLGFMGVSRSSSLAAAWILKRL